MFSFYSLLSNVLKLLPLKINGVTSRVLKGNLIPEIVASNMDSSEFSNHERLWEINALAEGDPRKLGVEFHSNNQFIDY